MTCSNHRDWSVALRLLREMLGERLESDVVSYSASSSASEKGSKWAQALALLRETFDRRLESDVVSYNASISASEKGSQWLHALNCCEGCLIESLNWTL